MPVQTTSELLLNHIASIADVNPGIAADLSEISSLIATFEATFERLEQRVLSLDTTNVNTLRNDDEIIDLNQQARADALVMLSAPLTVHGGLGSVKFVSKVFGSVAVTQNEILFFAAESALLNAFSDLLSDQWDSVASGLLPPFEQGTNLSELFVGNPDGGKVELLGQNDIFIPNDTTNHYTIDGGSGDDVIFGGEGGGDYLESRYVGGIGNDTIIAAYGAFELDGGQGMDWLQTNDDGYNRLIGRSGSDTLIGSGGNDRLFASDIPIKIGSNTSSKDTEIVIGRGDNDTVNGGYGNDILIGDNLNSAPANIRSKLDERVQNSADKLGSDGQDTLIGYAGNDYLAGGGDNDWLFGDKEFEEFQSFPSVGDNDGNDHLYGGSGDDNLVGSGGDDFLYGGSGNDTAYYLSGDNGTDHLWEVERVEAKSTRATGKIILEDKTLEQIKLIGGTNQLTITSKVDDVFVEIFGGSDSDLVTTENIDVVLNGGAGSDALKAVGGTAHLYGGGKEADYFSLSDGSFVMDADKNDQAYYGELYLSGGEQQIWQEGGWAYYTPFSSIVSALPGTIGGLIQSFSVLADIPSMTMFRYGLSESRQLIIELGLGRLGQAVIEDYYVDLETGEASGGITAFRQTIAEAGSIANLTQYLNLALKAAGYSGINGQDPLVIDMDGDGIELRAASRGDYYFDFDGDGFAERTDWVDGDDALLVRDLNGNGIIDDRSELFGDANQSGFEALAALDSNKNNLVSAADNQFNSLMIWQDANENGITDAGELISLKDAGITGIRVNPSATSGGREGGVDISASASVIWKDGTRTTAGDAIFNVDETDTRYLGDTSVSTAASNLPNLRGYGTLPDLRVSMSHDASLLSRVQTFKDLPISAGWGTYKADTQAILFDWADAFSVKFEQIKGAFNTRKLAVLEAYMGYEMADRNAKGVPSASNADELNDLWLELLDRTTLQLTAQGPLKSIVNGRPLDLGIDGFKAAGVNHLQVVYQNAINELPANATRALTEWRDNWVPFLEHYREALLRHDGQEVRPDFAIQQLLRAYDSVADSPLNFKQLATELNMPANLMFGTNGSERLARGAQDDLTIYLAEGGNDTLIGGDGQDVYVFNKQIGQDLIRDVEGPSILSGDRIRLAGHNPDQVTMSRDGEDLLLEFTNGGSIRVEDQYADRLVDITGRSIANSYGIEEIQFSNGEIYELMDIAAATGLGTNGRDTLVGSMHDDHLEGLKGNDLLQGGDGGDTYYYSRGDGNDTIQDIMTNTLLRAPDLLLLLNDINPDDISLERQGNSMDLVMRINGSSTITLKDQFFYTATGYGTKYALDNRIETLFFSNGESWNWIELQNEVIENYTTDKNDNVFGFGTSDTFNASSGNDTLRGLDGGDTYHFGYGSGKDVIDDGQTTPQTAFTAILGYDWSYDDRIVFGAGISRDDVEFIRTGPEPDLLIKLKGSNDQLTIIDQFKGIPLDLFGLLGDGWFGRVELFEFEDGTSLDWHDVLSIITTGTDGDDSIYGALTADRIDGRGGDDYLSGQEGSDIYHYDLGDGSDIIFDGATNLLRLGYDYVEFGEGISLADVSFSRVDIMDMRISILPTGDEIIIRDQYRVTETGAFGDVSFNVIEGFGWEDGGFLSAWDVMKGIIKASSTSGDDVIFGTHYDDTIRGGAGDDTLIGWNGEDIYLFSKGDGNDIIDEQHDNRLAGSYDIVRFLNVKSTETDVFRAGDDLILEYGKNDSLTIKDYFDHYVIGSNFQLIEKIKFSDGVNWTFGDVAVTSIEQMKTSGNDRVIGTHWDDILDGGLGNDTLEGGDGADTYIFRSGYGHDVIDERADYVTYTHDNDVLQFKGNIRLKDLTFKQINSGHDLKIIIDADNSIIIKDYLGQYNGIEHYSFSDGTSLTWDELVQYMSSQQTTNSHDRLVGTNSFESLSGGNGNDTILADDGDDTLVGGRGNDVLKGQGGADTYIYNLGDGNDTIREEGHANWLETDRLAFGAGITPSDISVSQKSEDIMIEIAGGGSILIKDWLGNSSERIEQITFKNGTVWNEQTIYNKSRNPTGGNDTIYGADRINANISGRGGNDYISTWGWDDTLKGGAGNDTLLGDWGDDYFVGGTGNDLMEGSYGSDRYVYNIGDGNDTINDQGSSTNTDRLFWGKNITQSDLTYIDVNGEDMKIFVKGGGSVYINWQMTVDGIERFVFDDGSSLSWQQVAAKTVSNQISGNSAKNNLTGTLTNDTISGGGGADTLRGANGSDRLIGGNGNDKLFGDKHNDTLIGGAGNDTLQGGAGNDRLIGGAGKDFLTGGAGKDVFVYTANSDSLDRDSGASANQHDRIYDFRIGVDVLDLKALSFKRFDNDGGSTEQYELRLQYYKSNDTTYLLSDQNDFAIQFNGDMRAMEAGVDVLFG